MKAKIRNNSERLLPPHAPGMRIGLFGGTFDPIHRGHIALATAAAATYQLGRVHFVPANVPPHKKVRADQDKNLSKVLFILY